MAQCTGWLGSGLIVFHRTRLIFHCGERSVGREGGGREDERERDEWRECLT